MSSKCNGVPKCDCGCETGSCKCKKITLNEAWDATMSVINFIPKEGLRNNFLIMYAINLVNFPFEVHKAIQFENMRRDISDQAAEDMNSGMREDEVARRLSEGHAAVDLATFEATKKWTLPRRNWGKVYGELSIMYENRLK